MNQFTPDSCPFCNETKIKFSLKTRGNYYHAAYYCTRCHCYGPRILVSMDKHKYRSDFIEDELIQARALAAWNDRCFDVFCDDDLK